MQNPKVPELVKKRFKSEAKEQGGTSCEGTGMSPQAKAGSPPQGTGHSSGSSK